MKLGMQGHVRGVRYEKCFEEGYPLGDFRIYQSNGTGHWKSSHFCAIWTASAQAVSVTCACGRACELCFLGLGLLLGGRTGFAWLSVRSDAMGLVWMIGAIPSWRAGAYSTLTALLAMASILGDESSRACARLLRVRILSGVMASISLRSSTRFIKTRLTSWPMQWIICPSCRNEWNVSSSDVRPRGSAWGLHCFCDKSQKNIII